MPPATNSGQALSNLQTAQNTQQTPDQIQQGVNTQLGVPQAQQGVSQLRQAITSTTNLLNNVAPSVYGRTGGSLVTTAQAGRQIQNESAPIQQTLNTQGTNLSNQESDLSNLLSEAGSQASLKEQGQQQNLSNLESIYKALYGQEQDKASQEATSAQQKEAVREFNASLKERASEASSSAVAKTPPPTTQNVTAALRQQLTGNKLVGGDGHVAPATLAAMYNTWVGYGLGDKQFWSAFQGLWNPKQANYGQQFQAAKNSRA